MARTLYQPRSKRCPTLEIAEIAYEHAERVLGAEHPDILSSLNNLASLYKSQGRYGEGSGTRTSGDAMRGIGHLMF